MCPGRLPVSPARPARALRLGSVVCALLTACAREPAPAPGSGGSVLPPPGLAGAAPPPPSAATAEPPTSSRGAPSSAPPPAASATGATSAVAPTPGVARGDVVVRGTTVDYPYDAADVGDATRAYRGRAFVPAESTAGATLPLLVFLHGLNRALIPHRWMGGGDEGDVRRIVGEMVARGALPPVVVAGPGSVQPAAVSGGASFPVFDVDRFIELTETALDGVARIDRARIVVAGHSGAGCSAGGGLVAAARARVRPLAILSIDTCMPLPLAEALGGGPPETHVVVTWQTVSWKRDFAGFQRAFARAREKRPGMDGVLRELEALPAMPRAHDATVSQTLEKWLPRVLPPAAR